MVADGHTGFIVDDVDELAGAMLDGDVGLRAMSSPDNNLGAVFDYLTGGAPR